MEKRVKGSNFTQCCLSWLYTSKSQQLIAFKNKHFTPHNCLLTPLKYHVFENIMGNGAFAFLEQMLHFP